MRNKIEEYRELLSVLPRNNIKNSKKYYEIAQDIKKEILEYREKLIEEIKIRASDIEYKDLSVNNYEEELKTYKSNIRILNDYNDFYEKSYLDIVLKNISKYYKNNLFKVNYDIYLALKVFKTVGIDLKSDDFIFGRESNEYMKVYFEENDINSVKLKESFDKLYWKSPDFILYICINLKYLYQKNYKVFKKFYTEQRIKLFPERLEVYVNEYKDKQKKYNIFLENNIELIQKKFIDEELDIKYFSANNIEKIKKELIIDPQYIYQEDENFKNLEYTLKEYRNYFKNKYIIEEVIKFYKEKIGKNELNNIIKSINKKEKKIISINKKIAFHTKFRGKGFNPEKYYIKINEILNELTEDYTKLEDLRFKDTLNRVLDDNSSYLDVLNIANSYKNALVNIIKEKEEDTVTIEKLEEIESFIYSPYNTIINNIMILEERNLAEIIIDKYKLMNIKIEEENLNGGLDNFITVIEAINIYNTMKMNNIYYDDLKFLVSAKKILKK